MPELPEVETIRRGLAKAIEGALITSVKLNRPDLRFAFPANFTSNLENRTILSVGRKAKYLTLYLDDNSVLVMHMGMSGSLHINNYYIDKHHDNNIIEGKHQDRNRLVAHDHVVFHLIKTNNLPQKQHIEVIYNDPRRFGYMDLISAEQLADHRYFCNLGIEPTGNFLDGKVINDLFASKKMPLKSALLDQRLIAGLGNIYVCEALWQAGLSPKRPANTICFSKNAKSKLANTKPNYVSDLAVAIRDVISRAIAAGGSSLNDYRQADGSMGYFQHQFNVYNRQATSCKKLNCEGTIEKIIQSGRSTYFCDTCQK